MAIAKLARLNGPTTSTIKPFPKIPDFVKNRSPEHKKAWEQWETEMDSWRKLLNPPSDSSAVTKSATGVTTVTGGGTTIINNTGLVGATGPSGPPGPSGPAGLSMTPKHLADGQLPSVLGPIFTATKKTVVTSIQIVNTDTTTNRTVDIRYSNPSGQREFCPKNFVFQAKHRAEMVDDEQYLVLEVGEQILGYCSVASTVDYVISGAEVDA
jgi:hypothetical protein